jgi:preprotein translocase subunit SecG
MIILLTIVHVLVCLFLIGVVLLQQGKSADLAAAFGGQGSQTAFGPRSAANLLSRITTWCAILFMCTSIGLTVLMQRSAGGHSVLENTKTTQQAHPAPAKK